MKLRHITYPENVLYYNIDINLKEINRMISIDHQCNNFLKRDFFGLDCNTEHYLQSSVFMFLEDKG